MSASAELRTAGELPKHLTGFVTSFIDDGRIEQQTIDLPINGEK